MMVQTAFVNRAEIESGVQRACQAFAPNVVRIRYSFGEDWTGDPSIFFRIVITDAASREGHLGELAETASNTIRTEVNADEMDCTITSISGASPR